MERTDVVSIAMLFCNPHQSVHMVTHAIDSVDVFSRLDVPMTRETAESVLRWKFTDDAIERMDELAEKARQGTLSDDERAAVETYERLNNLLGIIKSRARQFLKNESERGGA